ncbi:MAG: hypothetical protein ACK5T0_01655, partial [Vampirovibrionales bacterium]
SFMNMTSSYYPEYNVQMNSTQYTALPQATGAQLNTSTPNSWNQQAPQQQFQQPYGIQQPTGGLQQAPQQQYQQPFAIQQPASNFQPSYAVQQPTQSNWDSRGFSLVEPLGITSPNQQFYGQMRPNNAPQSYQQITNLPPTPRGAFGPASAIIGKSVGGIIPMPNSSLSALNPGSTGVLDPTPGAQQNYPPPHQMSQYPPQYQQQMQQNIQAIKQQQGQAQGQVQAPQDPQTVYMTSDWAVSQDQYEVDYRTIQFFEINKDIQGVQKEIADMKNGIFPKGVQMSTAEMLNASQNRLTQLTQQRDDWRKNNEGLPSASQELAKLMNGYASSKTDPNKKYDLYAMIMDFKDGRYPPKGRIDGLLASIVQQQQQPPIQQQATQPFTPVTIPDYTPSMPTANAWNPLPSGSDPSLNQVSSDQAVSNTSKSYWNF